MIKRSTKRKMLVLGLVFIFAFLVVVSSSGAVFGWRWGAGWPPPISYLFGGGGNNNNNNNNTSNNGGGGR